MFFIAIRVHWKWKWIITAFKLIIFYCLTTFCDFQIPKFFKYLPLGIFHLGLYFSFLLIKPSAVQYKLTAFHFVGAIVLYLFFMFKTREHVSNHAVHMRIFIFLFLRVLQFCDIKYLFAFSKSFRISSILTLSINVRLLH